MEPQIQYATTTDGAKIAFWSIGEGPPLVMMPPLPASHIELEWGIREWRAFYERLARHVTIVRYDSRGMGLSGRGDAEWSIEAFERDVDAVIRHLARGAVTLFGLMHSGPVACAYAAHHPEVVERLLLWGTYARNDGIELDREHWELRLLEQNWETYTETITHQVLGWSSGSIARQTAALLRESLTPEAMNRFIQFAFGIDVTELLPSVTAPTLIMHRRNQQNIVATGARDLAAGIAGSRLMFMDGDSMAPFMGNTQPFFTALAEFMGIPGLAIRNEPASAAAAPIRTIVFTDIAGSTALTQRLGDAGARALLRAHERIVRDALALHGGAEVKTLGDGFMASFGSATQGLQFAIAIQQATAEFNRDAPEPLAVRVGINAGEPIAERDDLFGTAVIAAARLADAAAGSEIIVSDVVRQLTAGKGFLFADRGERQLRGFDDPVRIHEVHWKDASA